MLTKYANTHSECVLTHGPLHCTCRWTSFSADISSSSSSLILCSLSGSSRQDGWNKQTSGRRGREDRKKLRKPDKKTDWSIFFSICYESPELAITRITTESPENKEREKFFPQACQERNKNSLKWSLNYWEDCPSGVHCEDRKDIPPSLIQGMIFK